MPRVRVRENWLCSSRHCSLDQVRVELDESSQVLSYSFGYSLTEKNLGSKKIVIKIMISPYLFIMDHPVPFRNGSLCVLSFRCWVSKMLGPNICCVQVHKINFVYKKCWSMITLYPFIMDHKFVSQKMITLYLVPFHY